MAGIENLFQSPEKTKKLKELARKFNTSIATLRELSVEYGVEGIDDIIKTLVKVYTERRRAIEDEHFNPNADITYVAPTRKRKEKIDAAEGETATEETVDTALAKTNGKKGGKKKEDDTL